MGRTPRQILSCVADMDCTKVIVDEAEKAIDVGVKNLKKRARKHPLLSSCLSDDGSSSLSSLSVVLPGEPTPPSAKKQRRSSTDKPPKLTSTESEESASAKKSISMRGQLLELQCRIGALERLVAVGIQKPDTAENTENTENCYLEPEDPRPLSDPTEETK